MNKAELIESVEQVVGSRKKATDVVEIIVDSIIREVAAGGRVAIVGFGTFDAVQRAARTGRNPATGETVRIEGTRAPRFRPAAAFRACVVDPQLLPVDGRAGVRRPGGPLRRPSSTTP